MKDEIDTKIAFDNSPEQSVYKKIINGKYVDPKNVTKILTMIRSNEFQSICRFLIMLSDRQGRTEKRMEDAYAKFPEDLKTFFKHLQDNLTKVK